MLGHPPVLRVLVEGRAPTIRMRPLSANRLATVTRDAGGVLLTIAADVEAARIAAVVRHMETQHADAGVSCCRLPECDAVLAWRPASTAAGRTLTG